MNESFSGKGARHVVPLLIATIALAAALLYLGFTSISLDDFDSVSFALVLDHFNIALQQPHPPGFPVYVAIAKAVHVLIPDERTALTFVSAIAGAIGVGAIMWLGVQFGRLSTGLLAPAIILTLAR